MTTVHSKSKAPARRNGSPARSSDQVSSQAGGAGAATVQMEEKTPQPALGAFYQAGPALSLSGSSSSGSNGANGHGPPSGPAGNGSNGAGGVQFKLAISRPGDPYEREADAAADRVTSGGVMPAITPLGPGALSRMVTLQRETAGEEEEQQSEDEVVQPCACEEEQHGNVEPPRVQRQPAEEEEQDLSNHEEVVQALAIQRQADDEEEQAPEAVQPCQNCGDERSEAVQPPAIQRQADDEEEQAPEAVQPCQNCGDERSEAVQPPAIQRQADGSGDSGSAHGSIGKALNSGPGESLDRFTRGHMEGAFGADFGKVRIHTGTSSAQAASNIRATAFTHGLDIHFAAGQYQPGTRRGEKLLAHELTHTIQQSNGQATAASSDSGAARSAVVHRQANEEPQEADDDPTLAAEFEQEVEATSADADQDADLMLRAWASRRHLLLTYRIHPAFKEREDLDSFLEATDQLAETELDTLGAFSAAGAELALAVYPKGFPLTWSGRVHAALTLGVDPATVIGDWAKSLTDLTQDSVALGPEIYAHGLPVPFADLGRLEDFRLRISDAKANEPSAVRGYARKSIRYMQLKWVSVFAIVWEGIVNDIASAVASGEFVPNYLDWKDFVDNKQTMLRDLPTRARDRLAETEEEAEQIQTDALKLGDAALAAGMAGALYSMFGLLSGWSDASALFDASLRAADALVASSGTGARLVAAIQWAQDNGYFSGAAAAWAQNLIDHGPEILAEIALIVILGMIPGVQVAVAIYLLVTLARDAIGLLGELASTLNAVMQATNVSQLQKAAAQLAQVLTNGAIFILIVLITEGIGKAAARLRKGAADLRAADKTLTEEAAHRKAFEKLPPEERKALEGGKVETAKQLAKKFEEFGGVCALGSITCRSKLPDHIVEEAGVYPKDYGVPMPGGAFSVQKAVLSGVARGTERLRSIARANRKLWPQFDRALAAAEKQGKDWIYDKNGVPWEVHHVKPVFMGGTNAPENLFPLPKPIHQKYTTWWNAVHRAFKSRFTPEEWDLIYWNVKSVPGSRVPTTPK